MKMEKKKKKQKEKKERKRLLNIVEHSLLKKERKKDQTFSVK